MVGIKIGKKGDAEYEGSRFFGDPVVTEKWASKEPWAEDCFFLCQYNLSEIPPSYRGVFPDKGYMYFFVDTSEDDMTVRVFFNSREPDTIYEDCNLGFEDDVDFDIFSDYPIEFVKDEAARSFACSECDDGIVLLQIDPRDTLMGVFRELNGALRVTLSPEDLAIERFDRAKTVIVLSD